ncbi:hypothetical protein PYH37_000627 [Sinorhizobium numidicum]|uniref:Uncharacterized protein n=1 Tax=Sinorhizobium numidicum TaxID=680248 RepID=A0ABY8CTK3_9HYPH|nr:hypothetical protein [Sinorhizobium numidicum]WEX75242.1 hypothetical protein PYH37_000627 [Sinorhizobium numidicum]WEX81237.1 hypothetical protein PYH38_000629 [Sinorhizobium numidicum]
MTISVLADIDKAGLTCETRDMPAPIALRSSFSADRLGVVAISQTPVAVRFIELRRRC